jgi:hypothetical protein
MVSAGLEVVATDAVDGDDITGEPVGGFPEAVAESSTDPLSKSAWVNV